MIEITMKELEKESEPKYKVEYQKRGSPIVYKRLAYNPIMLRDFLRGLDGEYSYKIYKIKGD